MLFIRVLLLCALISFGLATCSMTNFSWVVNGNTCNAMDIYADPTQTQPTGVVFDFNLTFLGVCNTTGFARASCSSSGQWVIQSSPAPSCVRCCTQSTFSWTVSGRTCVWKNPWGIGLSPSLAKNYPLIGDCAVNGLSGTALVNCTSAASYILAGPTPTCDVCCNQTSFSWKVNGVTCMQTGLDLLPQGNSLSLTVPCGNVSGTAQVNCSNTGQLSLSGPAPTCSQCCNQTNFSWTVSGVTCGATGLGLLAQGSSLSLSVPCGNVSGTAQVTCNSSTLLAFSGPVPTCTRCCTQSSFTWKDSVNSFESCTTTVPSVIRSGGSLFFNSTTCTAARGIGSVTATCQNGTLLVGGSSRSCRACCYVDTQSPYLNWSTCTSNTSVPSGWYLQGSTFQNLNSSCLSGSGHSVGQGSLNCSFGGTWIPTTETCQPCCLLPGSMVWNTPTLQPGPNCSGVTLSGFLLPNESIFVNSSATCDTADFSGSSAVTCSNGNLFFGGNCDACPPSTGDVTVRYFSGPSCQSASVTHTSIAFGYENCENNPFGTVSGSFIGCFCISGVRFIEGLFHSGTDCTSLASYLSVQLDVCQSDRFGNSVIISSTCPPCKVPTSTIPTTGSLTFLTSTATTTATTATGATATATAITTATTVSAVFSRTTPTTTPVAATGASVVVIFLGFSSAITQQQSDRIVQILASVTGFPVSSFVVVSVTDAQMSLQAPNSQAAAALLSSVRSNPYVLQQSDPQLPQVVDSGISNSQSTTSNSGSQVPVGIIVGVVLGGLALLAAGAVFAIVVWRRRQTLAAIDEASPNPAYGQELQEKNFKEL